MFHRSGSMFFSELKYNVVYLEDARSIAMTSFFSLKSVSPLDLQVNERSFHLTGLYDFFFREGSFFCSEESFRNHVVPERRLLYSLNLDPPKGREYSNLRSGFAPAYLPQNARSFFVAVRGHYKLFRDTLILLIQSVFEQTGCKFKRIKWMVNFRPLESFFLPVNVQNLCGASLYRDCVNSALAIKFFEKFIDLNTFCRIGESKVFEHFLKAARLLDFQIRGKLTNRWSLTDYCFYHHGFRVVPSILKYEDSAYYTDKSYESLKRQIYHQRYPMTDEEFNRLENRMSKSRLYRIMQIIQVYRRHEFHPTGSLQRAEVSNALRLVWRSIPDSYVSHQEMTEAYAYLLPPCDIREAHSFYETVIGQIVPYPEPRPLIHYCRTAIRRSLCNSKQWLPDGINQLKLSPRETSFLNLQKDNLKPDNFQPEGSDEAVEDSSVIGVLFESSNR